MTFELRISTDETLAAWVQAQIENLQPTLFEVWPTTLLSVKLGKHRVYMQTVELPNGFEQRFLADLAIQRKGSVPLLDFTATLNLMDRIDFLAALIYFLGKRVRRIPGGRNGAQ